MGIGAEDREKIFLPFYTTKPSGTGLGMSIVKKIVDLHGGDIAVESAPGRGTRVRIALPAATVHPIATGGVMKRKILLVEDDDVFLRPLHADPGAGRLRRAPGAAARRKPWTPSRWRTSTWSSPTSGCPAWTAWSWSGA